MPEEECAMRQPHPQNAPEEDIREEIRLSTSPAARWWFMWAGHGALVLGIIGMILPVMPTSPFLILSAACYARGSEAFYIWLVSNRFFGPPIRQYRRTGKVPRVAKYGLIATYLILFSFTIAFLVPGLWPRLGVGVLVVVMTIAVARIPSA